MDKKEKGNGNKSGPLFLDRKEKKQLRKDHQGDKNQTGSWYRSNVDEKHNDYNKKTCFLRSLSHGSSRESVLFISREWWAAVIIQSLFRGYLVCLLDQNLCFLEKFMLTFKDVFFYHVFLSVFFCFHKFMSFAEFDCFHHMMFCLLAFQFKLCHLFLSGAKSSSST